MTPTQAPRQARNVHQVVVLAELVVADLGVIHHASVVLGDGMTVITGETGAGKTLIVEAIELLLGARSDPTLVRSGADEARVDGRFIVGDAEVVLSRVVPRAGRARAYVDGRPVPVGVLAERASSLIDLHGQHAHQTLLAPASQRDAIDAYGGIDDSDLRDARSKRRMLLRDRALLGGDERARAREIDLLSFQVAELHAAGLSDPAEDEKLADEEDLLTGAQAHREAVSAATEALAGDDGVLTLLGTVRQLLGGKAPFASEADRIRNASSELDDVASELRSHLARLDDDPSRLGELRERRHLLRQLRRKYGESIGAMLVFQTETQERLDELLLHDERAATIDDELRLVAKAERRARDRIAKLRGEAAEPFAASVRVHLGRLALGNARFRVAVLTDDDGTAAVAGVDAEAAVDSKVVFEFSANPGSDLAPLAKVASGGELARVMLALQLALINRVTGSSGVLSAGSVSSPLSALVFDEVDAGIGGETALSVGDALAELGSSRQVLVVTHLAQVAASADAQIHVRKTVEAEGDGGPMTRTTVSRLSERERVGEVARMLAGDPASPAALRHAEVLLASRRSRRGADPTRARGKRAPERAKRAG